MLAFGWTVSKHNLSLDDLDITIPVAIFVLVMHALIGGLIFLDHDEYHKYHDYSGV